MTASSIEPARIATSALHLTSAVQGSFAILGAATAMFVIGRGWRGRTPVADSEVQEPDRATARAAAERPSGALD